MANFLTIVTTTTHFTKALFASFFMFIKACNSADKILIGRNCFPSKLKSPFLEFVVEIVPKLTSTVNDRTKNKKVVESILNLTNRIMIGANSYKLTCLSHVFQANACFDDIFIEFALTIDCLKDSVKIDKNRLNRLKKIVGKIDQQKVKIVERVTEDGI